MKMRPALALFLVVLSETCGAQTSGGRGSQNIGVNQGIAINLQFTLKLPSPRAAPKKPSPDSKLVLEPGDEAVPMTPCDGEDREAGAAKSVSAEPANALRFYLAGGRTICLADDCVLLTSRGQKLVWMERRSGVAKVYAKLWAGDGTIAAEVDSNRIYRNVKSVPFIKRPDKHTVVVTDRSGNELLKLNFLNRNSIYLTGIFYPPPPSVLDVSQTPTAFRIDGPAGKEGVPLIITDKAAVIPGGSSFGRMCTVSSGSSDVNQIGF